MRTDAVPQYASTAVDGSPRVAGRDMPVPLLIALVLVAAVWAAGAVWSFDHQTRFALALGFHPPQLLPLVCDGLPVAMAAVAFAAAVDGRPATAARLGTALAVAGSSVSNGMYAHRRSDGDLTTVIVAVAIPVMAAVAFEVLLGELRKQVLQARGRPAPAPIPPLRPIRVALDPFRELGQWRRHVLTVTDPAVDPETREALARMVAAIRAGVPESAVPVAAVPPQPSGGEERLEAPQWGGGPVPAAPPPDAPLGTGTGLAGDRSRTRRGNGNGPAGSRSGSRSRSAAGGSRNGRNGRNGYVGEAALIDAARTAGPVLAARGALTRDGLRRELGVSAARASAALPAAREAAVLDAARSGIAAESASAAVPVPPTPPSASAVPAAALAGSVTS